MDLVKKIKLLGEQFSDFKVVEKMLISLPSRFEPKVSAIEESCDLTNIPGAERSEKGKSVLTVREGGKGKFLPYSFSQKTNHLVKDCWAKDISKVQYRFCKRYGHFEKFYKTKQNQNTVQNRNHNSNKQANYIDGREENEGEVSQPVCLIHNGCNSHMANEDKMFNKLDRSINTKVTLVL
ncbi:hypothetical protein MANES_01G051560v8 [Manihot esculenta]|uniref:Uncharacterized protein n=1 Tax=Manihot esculenta TaxID=3983 RepID=A0ACB7ICV6_MANES|nr:hypothetical protein MANES_01G051560v8 [Manihot esculenta]